MVQLHLLLMHASVSNCDKDKEMKLWPEIQCFENCAPEPTTGEASL